MNDSAFVIAMAIGMWTLIFNLVVNFSGIPGTEGYFVLVSVVVNTAVWFLQLEGSLTPETASLIIVSISVFQTREYGV